MSHSVDYIQTTGPLYNKQLATEIWLAFDNDKILSPSNKILQGNIFVIEL